MLSKSFPFISRYNSNKHNLWIALVVLCFWQAQWITHYNDAKTLSINHLHTYTHAHAHIFCIKLCSSMSKGLQQVVKGQLSFTEFTTSYAMCTVKNFTQKCSSMLLNSNVTFFFAFLLYGALYRYAHFKLATICGFSLNSWKIKNLRFYENQS